MTAKTASTNESALSTGVLSNGLEFSIREPTAKDIAKSQYYATQNEMGEAGSLIYLTFACAAKWGTRTQPLLEEIEGLPAKDLNVLNNAFEFFRAERSPDS